MPKDTKPAETENKPVETENKPKDKGAEEPDQRLEAVKQAPRVRLLKDAPTSKGRLVKGYVGRFPVAEIITLLRLNFATPANPEAEELVEKHKLKLRPRPQLKVTKKIV